MRFENLWDLTRLPYFAVKDGEIGISDPAFGPSIDLHTHLALSYYVPRRLDLERPTPCTRHYLPAGRPFELDNYANQNIPRGDLARLKLDLTLGSLTPFGMRATHTAANLEREMAALGIRTSAILPIEFARGSRNAEDYLAVARNHRRIVAFGSVHPRSEDPIGRLEAQVRAGARGLKLHPAVQGFPPDDPAADPIYEACGRLGVAVLWHCGPVGIETRRGRSYSQVRLYRDPIARHPETCFILGHAGALQPEEALQLSVDFPNVYLELSSQSLSMVRRIVERGPLDRIVFGSDWPFYHQALALAKVLIATEGAPEARRAVLHDNAARLLGRSGIPLETTDP